MERECGHCDGTGWIEAGQWPCSECKATGWVDPEPFCRATDDDPECTYPACFCRDLSKPPPSPELRALMADMLKSD